ncbi:Uncharacterized protein FWK35_00033220 [Aphis craccivora]|uniref:Craniofacial development protein 2-like n=1 Tax=Aphis craccivora TaxID=307492 RepID=A0A6G0W0P7_APHCR|nr:Uncharacterized protein FWK35_00033220 [Aphis craccivora]
MANDLIRVSETHWKTTGHITTTNGNLVISSSIEQESINCVAVIINKDIKNTVLGYNTFNDRIILLTEVVRTIPTKELLFVTGNLTAKIGTTNNEGHNMISVVGKCGIENNLFITKKNFKHHISILYTWQCPYGQYRSQIDYILVRNRWKSSVKDIKKYPGMDCGNDHNALVVEICLILIKSKQLIPRTKLNT